LRAKQRPDPVAQLTEPRRTHGLQTAGTVDVDIDPFGDTPGPWRHDHDTIA
jgi:hypothetical protein